MHFLVHSCIHLKSHHNHVGVRIFKMLQPRYIVSICLTCGNLRSYVARIIDGIWRIGIVDKQHFLMNRDLHCATHHSYKVFQRLAKRVSTNNVVQQLFTIIMYGTLFFFSEDTNLCLFFGSKQ